MLTIDTIMNLIYTKLFIGYITSDRKLPFVTFSPHFYFSPGFQIYRTFLKVRAHLFPHGAWGKKKALLLSYWYQVQAAQDGVGDILIGKFFDVGYFAASGLSPAYKRYAFTRAHIRECMDN